MSFKLGMGSKNKSKWEELPCGGGSPWTTGTSEFDHRMNDWPIFLSKFTNRCVANSITAPEKIKANLLSSFSEESYALLRDLCVPEDPNQKSYEELLGVLDRHFTPVRCCFAARFQFLRARCKEGESAKDWSRRLRGLAANCSFGSELGGLLRDVFVTGCRPGPVQDRLFEENVFDLTFERAVGIASCKEASTTNGTPAAALNKRNTALGKPGVKPIKSTSRMCTFCGRTSHTFQQCWYKSYWCNNCCRRGHLDSNCRFKNSGPTHNRDDTPESECFQRLRSKDISDLHFNCDDSSDPVTVLLNVEGVPLNFEVDTGSSYALISESDYSKLFDHIEMAENDLSLKDYTGRDIVPCGKISLDVKRGSRSAQLITYVIRNGGPPLLGRIGLRKLGLLSSAVAGSGNSVKEICDKYPRLFGSDTGSFNRYKISLRLKPHSTPTYLEPRNFPPATTARIDEEIERSLREGLLVAVPVSEWATPILPVSEDTTQLRICGDFNTTVNPLLEVSPVPKMEDLFSKIGGAKLFSKIYLKDPYQQLILEEGSRKILTINTHRGLFSYTRLPFGLPCSAALLQKAVEHALADVDGIIIFRALVLVTGSSFFDHNSRLDTVLHRLKEADLRVQMNECSFLEKSVVLLGRVIDENGVHSTQENDSRVIKAFPNPSTELINNSFTALVKFYSKFIPTVPIFSKSFENWSVMTGH